MISDPTHQLRLGDLDLIGRAWMPGGWRIQTRAEGTTWGNPEPVLQEVQGLLQDGAVVSLDSWTNREARLVVQVEGQSGQSLATGVAALEAQTRKRNTLVWTGPQEFTEPVVFDVEFSHLEHELDDEDELLRRQAFVLVMQCSPFVRSLEPILSPVMSAPPPPSSPTVVLVDACESTTGWSATPAPIATSGGYVYNTTYSTTIMLERAGTVSLASTPYLVVDWSRARTDGSRVWTAPVITPTDINEHYLPIQTMVLDAAWARSVYDLTEMGPSASVLRFWVSSSGGAAERLFIRHVERTDQVPTGGVTGHQLARTIPVEGSARTRASLHVWRDSGASPLGDVLIHTSPTPHGMLSLDQFRVSSATLADGTVSGTSKPLSSSVAYQIPAGFFDPSRASGYLVLARVNRSGTGVLTATTQSFAEPFNPVGSEDSTSAAPPSMSGWTIVNLGSLHMPPTRVGGGDAFVSLWISLASPTGTPVLDDVWLVDMESGSLTWLTSDRGHIWIDSPTTDDPYPLVWVGAGPNREAAYVISPVSHMRHDFPPGDLHIFTVVTGVASSKAQLEYHRRGLISLPPRSA